MNDVRMGTAPAAARPLPAAPDRSGEAAGLALRRAASALPADAVALIARRPEARPLMQGRRAGGWVLRFPPRWPAGREPLMGWWGGGDPLQGLELRFPSRHAAEAFARREGIRFEVAEPPMAAPDLRRAASLPAIPEPPADPALCWAWDGRVAEAPWPAARRGRQELALAA